MRHVDDTHEAEDESEPTCDHEIDAGGGEAVEQGGKEVLRIVDCRPEVRLGPNAAVGAAGRGEKADPEYGEGDRCSGEGPRGITRKPGERDPLVHLRGRLDGAQGPPPRGGIEGVGLT